MPGMCHEITLIKTALSDDAYQTATESKRVVYAEKKPNHASEFHAALAHGFELQHTFQIHAFEYEGEKTVLYDGQMYDVYRTYTPNADWCELYLTSKRRA